MVGVALLTALGAGWFWFKSLHDDYEADVKRLTSQYNKEHRHHVRDEVVQALHLVNHVRQQADERLKRELKEQLYAAHAMATSIYNTYHGKKEPAEIKRMICEALRPARFNQGRGYYYIFGMDGIAHLWPLYNDREGKDVFDYRDADNKLLLYDMMKMVRKQTEGYYRYRIPRRRTSPTIVEKLAFVKHFAPYDWYIGTGEYMDDHLVAVKREALSFLHTKNLEHVDYIFVGQWDGMTLLGPKAGSNLLADGSLYERSMVTRMIKVAKDGGGFVEYIMPPGTPNVGKLKVSYVAGIPEWRWHLGAGVYGDDIAASIQEKQQYREDLFARHVQDIALLLVGVLGLVGVVSYFLSKVINADLYRYRSFLEQAATEGVTTPPETYHFAEFKKLARDGNEMVQQRQEAYDATIASETRFQSLADNAPNALLVVHQDGDILYMNPRFVDTFGYSRDELQNTEDWFVRAYPDATYREYLRERWVQEVSVAQNENGMIKPREVYIACKDGSRVIMEITAAWSGDNIIIQMSDVTARREAEKALIRSEKRYRSLFSVSLDGIVIINADGVLLDCNESYWKMLGYTRKEIIGMNIFEFTPKRWHDWESKEIIEKRLLGKSGHSGTYEKEYIHKDGTIFPIEITAYRVGDIGDKDMILWGAVRDISERKRLEEQLRQSEKLQAIGQLAGGVAHDFNNQLGGIMGYAELLESRLNDDKLKEYAHQIIESTQRSADLTTQLLAFARKGNFQIVEVDINSVIADVTSMLEHTIDRKIRTDEKLSVEQPFVMGDRSQIQNALLNLALNARDSMPEGGTITFETKLVSLEDESSLVHSFDLVPGDYLQVSVCDTGKGIEPEIRRHIFEPFFTTKQKGKGTGMGLAAVYGTMKLHHGAVSLYSEIDKGSVFRLYFPVTAHTVKTVEPAVEDKVMADGEHILLVDDERIIRTMAAEHLQDAGYRVTMCENGREALEFYRENGADVDLVILDMIMPDMSGRETFNELMAIDPKVRIVLSSGFSVSGEASRTLEDGALEFIQKPFRRAALLKVISSVLQNE
jgi:PAS domain S-box-containing protein